MDPMLEIEKLRSEVYSIKSDLETRIQAIEDKSNFHATKSDLDYEIQNLRNYVDSRLG